MARPLGLHTALLIVSLVGWNPITAEAKGGPGVSANTMTVDRVRVASGLFTAVGSSYDCPTPTNTQCNSVEYSESLCGQFLGARITAGSETACQGYCSGLLLQPATCLNEDWFRTMCGRHEARLMALPGAYASHPSRCVRMLNTHNRNLQQSNGTLFPQAATGPVIVPETLRTGTGSAPLAAGSRASVRLPAYQPRIGVEGGDSTVHGRRARDQIRLSNPDSRTSANIARQARLAVWESNGNQVESCEEYQYEKYYDYNLFEDAIAGLGNDHRAIFDVAYADPQQGANAPRAALGTRGAANVQQAQRDGTVLNPQVFTPIPSRPKNIYFSFGVPTNAERAEIIAAWNAIPDIREDKTPRPYALGELVLLDEDLHARLLAGQPRHTDHWAYHRAKSNALMPNYLDEELYRFDAIKQRYERLLHRRAEYLAILVSWIEDTAKNTTYDAIRDILGLPFHPSDIISMDRTRATYDPYAQTFDLQNQVRATYASSLQTSLTFNNGTLFDGANAAVPRSSLHSGELGFQPRAGGLSRYLAAGSDGGRFVAASLPKKVIAGDPYTQCLNTTDVALVGPCLFKAIAITDGELEEELKLARNLACLDAGDQPCDWSPAHFTQRLHDPYTALREPEYARCQQYTAERGFDPLRNATFRYDLGGGQVLQPTVDGQPCANGDYTTSPTQLERFFRCTDRLRLDLIAFLTQVTGSASIISPNPPYRVQIGGNASDYSNRGNNRFRAKVDYDGTWALSGLPTDVTNPNYCSAQPSFNGHVALGGTANSKASSFFNAQVSLSRTPGVKSKGVIEVLGNEIVGVEGQLGGGAFNIIQDSAFRSQTFVEARATVVVVVVPVTFRAGITGRVGASVSLGAGLPVGANGGCADGHIALAGEFRPSAGVTGYMSASLDALIVEAGVKGEIELITLELPTRIELTLLGERINNRVEPKLTVRSNMDLVLKTLGGRISAFVEICFIACERFEETIFRWDGLRFTSNLFKSEFEVPLGPLVDYNASL